VVVAAVTPAETIAAAIEKLEHLRSRGSDGPWRVDVLSRTNGTVAVSNEVGRYVAHYVAEPDAERIVTLHRTIDAQLAILQHALARAESKISTGGNDRAVWSHEKDAYRLAALILNDAAAMHDAMSVGVTS
jgi:hypothetical protein